MQDAPVFIWIPEENSSSMTWKDFFQYIFRKRVKPSTIAENKIKAIQEYDRLSAETTDEGMKSYYAILKKSALSNS